MSLKNRNRLVCGRSGSGKTTFIVDYINKAKHIDYVMIVSQTIDVDDAYNKLTKPIVKVRKFEAGFKQSLFDFQLNHAPAYCCLLMDDIVGLIDEKRKKDEICSIVTMCRKYRIEFIGIVQGVKRLPPTFRDNIAVINLTGRISQPDLQNSYEYISEYFPDFKTFKKYYDEKCNEKKYIFFEFGVTERRQSITSSD